MILLSGLLSAGIASAHDVGETVVVMKATDVKVGSDVVHRHQPGITLVVGAVNGDWLWVNGKFSGWVASKDVVTLPEALDHYTAQINKSPRDANLYNSRGLIWSARGEWEVAIGDFSEAIRHNPRHHVAYANRGIAWRNAKNFDKAISDYTEALRISPKNAMVLNNRGIAYRYKGQFGKAIADFQHAIDISPKHAGAHNSLAWLYATCPEASVRNGTQAVESAKRACELTSWKSAEAVETLAAAYAETGDFKLAIHWQTHAHDLHSDARKDKSGELLAAFREGTPVREGFDTELASGN
jgi:tetratricopeptide (TPR) repeat protein